ncbi:MAG: YccF domain-containing protein [Acidithiobacillus sp.]|uniref:YccF domain-containing protein n=1 Tax=Acidithiobacillus sp. TaxID=1872118 RepID=UPI0025872600|nr:YccF domain-containing protein [Acidithiobacillus sp.]MCE5421163.1 YccF domain-containing protein [Acidithiobacillus sp.]
MRLLGNIIWFLFGGLVMGIGWWIAAILSAITIIGIPWAIAAFRIGTFSFWPFGREIVDKPSGAAGKTLSLLGNIIWILLCGWWLALGHLISALLCAITIIGIPFAIQNIKLAALALAPFGKEIVPIHSRPALA